MDGLLSRPCEDIFKKTIYSNEIQENYTTRNHNRLCKSYRDMVKSDPVINVKSNHTYPLPSNNFTYSKCYSFNYDISTMD